MSEATANYLGVRYSAKERPFTTYPGALTAHLTDRFLTSHRGGKLVDVGSGRGEFLREFALLGFDACGVDRELSSEKIFPEVVHLANLETDRLPFDDDSLDIVFNKSVLEHTSNVTHLLGECRRVLRPGGVMISLVPDWKAQWSHFYDDWTHVRPFTLVGLRECLLSHGYEVVRAERFRQLPLLWKRPYLRPLADLATLLPDAWKTNKWVRFSKEWMLLAVARKPGAGDGPGTNPERG